MKKLITLVTLCALSGTISAQSETWSFSKTNRLKEKAPRFHLQLVKSHGLQTTPAGAHKSTATEQRLKAAVELNAWSPGLSDSTVFIYSGTNGSTFDFGELNYQTEYRYPEFKGGPFVKFDKAYTYNTGFPTPHDSVITTYSATNKPLSQGGKYEITYWTYNAQDQVSADYDLDWNSTSWDTLRQSFYSYTGQNMTVDSGLTWNGSSITNQYKDIYTYNGNNMPIGYLSYKWNGSGWEEDYRSDVTYTSGGLMETIISQEYNGTGWENDWKDSSVYTSGKKTMGFEYEWDGSAWQLSSEGYMHLNTSNLPDSVFFRDISGGSWDTMYAKVTYNSFGNPTGVIVYDHEFSMEETRRYYYEEFESSAVPEVSSVRSVTLYPNPAKDALYVRTGQIKEGGIEYIILNNLGQVVVRASVTAVAGQNISIPVRHLNPGMYHLRILDAANAIYSASFIRE